LKKQLFYRREAGNCRICWSADAALDVQLGGKNTKAVKKVGMHFGYILQALNDPFFSNLAAVDMVLLA